MGGGGCGVTDVVYHNGTIMVPQQYYGESGTILVCGKPGTITKTVPW